MSYMLHICDNEEEFTVLGPFTQEELLGTIKEYTTNGVTVTGLLSKEDKTFISPAKLELYVRPNR